MNDNLTTEDRVELAIINLENHLRHNGIRISVEVGVLELMIVIDNNVRLVRMAGTIGEQSELPRHGEEIGLDISKNILVG